MDDHIFGQQGRRTTTLHCLISNLDVEAFSAAAPSEWNTIPAQIKIIVDKESF